MHIEVWLDFGEHSDTMWVVSYVLPGEDGFRRNLGWFTLRSDAVIFAMALQLKHGYDIRDEEGNAI